MNRRLTAVVLTVVACGSRSALDGAPDVNDASIDAATLDVAPYDARLVDAPPPPNRACATPGEWAIALGPSVSGLSMEGSSVDVGSDGNIVATVAGWPSQTSCHSGPTIGSGGCAVLIIAPTSDILLERRFACEENWNITRNAFALDDGGFVLAALVPKGGDVGSGLLQYDSLIVARYAHDGGVIYVDTFPSQQSALSVGVRHSGEAVVAYANNSSTLSIERLDPSGKVAAARSFAAQADVLNLRAAYLDTGEVVFGGGTGYPTDWGDGVQDTSALVAFDASLATLRILHPHDVIVSATLKATHQGSGFSYSGVSTSCALDFGSGPLGCGGEADIFAARFTDPFTLAFARVVGDGSPQFNFSSCVDDTNAFTWTGRAGNASTFGSKTLSGPFIAALDPTGATLAAAAFPSDQPQVIACDTGGMRVVGGELVKEVDLGPATLPVGGFILRRHIAAFFQ